MRAIQDILPDRNRALIKYKLSCEKDLAARVRLEELNRELAKAKEKADAGTSTNSNQPLAL